MNSITSRSYRLFALVIIMVISAIFATLPALAGAEDVTFCYPDGCVTLPRGPNGNVAAQRATSAAGLMATIDARNVSLYGTSGSQSNSSGNLTSVSCNNGVTASATYNAPAPAPTCSIAFEQNPIAFGSSTVIHWSSKRADFFHINTIGRVEVSGSTLVSPSHTTDYSGNVSNSRNGTDASCHATLVVSCPSGYVLRGSTCIFAGCPSGYVLQGTQCVASNACTTPNYCQGKDLRNGCTDKVIATCEWGCTQARCNDKPMPTATLMAVPSLVHSGNTSKISWTSQNATSCTVTGTNGDRWTGLSSTGKTSKAISSQTTFTLVCQGHPNVNPPSTTRSVIVNIAPSYEEK